MVYLICVNETVREGKLEVSLLDRILFESSSRNPISVFVERTVVVVAVAVAVVGDEIRQGLGPVVSHCLFLCSLITYHSFFF